MLIKQGDGNPTELEFDHKLCVSPWVSLGPCICTDHLSALFHFSCMNFICPCSHLCMFFVTLLGMMLSPIIMAHSIIVRSQNSQLPGWLHSQKHPLKLELLFRKSDEPQQPRLCNSTWRSLSTSTLIHLGRYHSKYYRTLHKI